MDKQLLVGNLKNFLAQQELEKNFQVRLGQKSIFQALCNFFQRGEQRGYIKLPSGVGKTNLAIWLFKATQVPRVLFMVPRIILVEQTIRRFQKLMAIQEIDSYFGGQKKSSAPIVVSTYQKFQKNKKPQDFDLVIWDEVHEALTQKRSRIMDHFGPESIHLGLTASDAYNPGKKVPNLMPLIHNMEIEEAIKLGILAGVQCWLAKTNIDIGKIKVKGGHYDRQTQVRIIDIVRRNQAAVEIYQRYLAGQTCLVTTINISHAIKVAELFQKAGIRAEAVWGGCAQYPLPMKIVMQRLEDFRSGNIQVLTTVDLIDKGFDNTLLTALINLRITGSVVKATQRGGRVLRLFNGHDDQLPFVQSMLSEFGGKLATVVDFIDDCKNHGFRPVLFPDILKGTFKLPPYMDAQKVTGIKREMPLWPADLDIKFQIELITDITQVAMVTKELTTYDNLPVANKDGLVFLPIER